MVPARSALQQDPRRSVALSPANAYRIAGTNGDGRHVDRSRRRRHSSDQDNPVAFSAQYVVCTYLLYASEASARQGLLAVRRLGDCSVSGVERTGPRGWDSMKLTVQSPYSGLSWSFWYVVLPTHRTDTPRERFARQLGLGSPQERVLMPSLGSCSTACALHTKLSINVRLSSLPRTSTTLRPRCQAAVVGLSRPGNRTWLTY